MSASPGGRHEAPAPTNVLVAVLVLATALGPFAMQVFLPALPSIQIEFATSAAKAQLAFSLSAFAIAIATLFYGPLSDRFGRRPALVGGLLVYLIGSLMCAAAPSIGILILGRIVQAAGGCAGLVLSRAIIRDLFSLDRSATVLAYVTMAMVAAPDGGAGAGRAAHRPCRLARGVPRRHGPGRGDPGGRAGGTAGDGAAAVPRPRAIPCTASARSCARPASWATPCRAPSRSPCSTPSSRPPRSWC